MLDKLKIAAVLLVIGAISGISIWGVNELTAPVIERNQAAAEAEMYREIFPDLDTIDIQDYDHDFLNQMVIIKGSNGNEIGRVFRGTVSNNFGQVTALVGIKADGTIARVIISDHDNTPNYANIIINDYLPNFDNQDITNLSFDTNTGATATYNAVRRIVEAAVIQVAGDVRLEAYETMFEDADSYESDTVTVDGVDELYNVFNADDALIGRVYEITANGEGIYIAFNTDDELVAVKYQDSLDDVSAFDDYIGMAADEISLDVSGDLEDAIAEVLQAILDSLSGVTPIDGEYLVSYRNYYENDELVGYLFEGRAEGFGGQNIIAVAINFSGEIIKVELIDYSDTPDYVEDIVIPSLADLEGLTSLDGLAADDTFSGASATGGSIFDVVGEAFEYFSNNLSDSTPIDHDILTRRDNYYDGDERVGYTYFGVASGFGGDVQVLVTVLDDGEIVSVELGDNSETDWILDDYVYDALATFEGLSSIADLAADDTFAGATATGEAILDVVGAALTYHEEGPSEPTDPDDDEDDEEVIEKIDISGEYLYGYHEVKEDDVLIGYQYYGQIEGHNGDMIVTVVMNLDEEIVRIEVLENVESGWALTRVLNDIDVFTGLKDISDIDVDDVFAGVTVTAQAIYDVVEEALGFHQVVLNMVMLDHGILDYYLMTYDETDTLIGYTYFGTTSGFRGDMTTSVLIGLDGQIKEVLLLDNSESGWAADQIIEELSMYEGLTTVEAIDPSDVYAGATATGVALHDVVEAALTDFNTTIIEHSVLDQMVNVYEDNTLVGYRYYGTVSGFRGDIVTAVTLDLNGVVVSVDMVEESESGWAADQVADELSIYEGLTNVDDIEPSDVYAGATATGDAVHQVVVAALAHFITVDIEDDLLTHYIKLLEDGEEVGYIFYGVAEGFRGDMVVAVEVDLEGMIVNVQLLENSESGWAADQIIAELDMYEGLMSLDDLDLDAYTGATATGDALHSVVEAVMAYIHSTQLSHDVLTHYVNVYDNSNLIGYRYYGVSEGFRGDIVTAVTLDLNGAIVSVEMVEENESGWAADQVADELSVYDGLIDASDIVPADTYTGATATGRAVHEVVLAALAHERDGE